MTYDSADVTICVASFNTSDWTELCVRSIHRMADAPFRLRVGDSGSTDGSVEMLASLERAGWLTLEQAPKPRMHAEWLDHWLAMETSRWLIFADSDIEILRGSWLSTLLRAAERDRASIAFSEMLPEVPHFVEPVGHKTVRLTARPAPWMMLVETGALRALDASFAFRAVESASVPEGLIAYDVGAYTYARAREAGLNCLLLDDSFRPSYRHFGGASWRTESLNPREIGRRLRARRAVAHLKALRRRQSTPSEFHVTPA